MNPLPGIDQPSQGIVWSKRTGRRTFLKGAGLAGAASLAGPLLARTHVRPPGQRSFTARTTTTTTTG